ASARKTRLDLLQQPAVAIRIPERGECAIAPLIRRPPAGSVARSATPKLRAWGRGGEHVTHLRPVCDERAARAVDVRNNQIQRLGRARSGRRDIRAELDRARRPGRCELDHPETVVEGEVGVETPAE